MHKHARCIIRHQHDCGLGSEGRLIVNLDFHKRAIAKKEKRLLRAKRNLNQMQRKVWRLEKVVSKGNNSTSDDSSMFESDASGPVEFSTPQPSSSRAQRHTPLQTLHRSFAAKLAWLRKGCGQMQMDLASQIELPEPCQRRLILLLDSFAV